MWPFMVQVLVPVTTSPYTYLTPGTTQPRPKSRTSTITLPVLLAPPTPPLTPPTSPLPTPPTTPLPFPLRPPPVFFLTPPASTPHALMSVEGHGSIPTPTSKKNGTAKRSATAASASATAPSAAIFATTTRLATRKPSLTAK